MKLQRHTPLILGDILGEWILLQCAPKKEGENNYE